MISLTMESQNMQTGAVIGTVTSGNNNILQSATLIIEELPLGGQTDIDGNYYLKNIPFGTYTITASFIGYKNISKTIIIKAKTTRLNFKLTERLELLEEVSIAGKTKKRKIETEGFAVNALEVQDIKEQSVQVTEILDQSAGIRLRQSGGMGSRINYNINGLSGNSIRIFIDGIPIQNYGASFSISSIPVAMIERIEVYKGVVPANLGSDALGGAINVVLNKALKNTIEASYSFGSFNTHQAGINANYRDTSSGFTVKGSGFYNYTDNSYKVWGNQVYITDIKTGEIEYVRAKRFHDAYQSKGVKADAGFTNVKWADQFLIGTVISNMRKEIQHGATMESVYGSRKGEQATVMLNTTYAKKNFLTKNLDVNVFASYSDLTRKVIDTIPLKYNWRGELTEDYWNTANGEWLEHITGAEGNSPTLNKNYEKTYAVRSNLAYQITKHHKITGNLIATNFKRNSHDPLLDENIRELLDTRHLSKKILGLTYELNGFNDKLKTSVFYKYYKQDVTIEKPENISGQPKPVITRFDKKIDETGYGMALSYAITPRFQLMTSAENAVRLPETQELFGNDIENTDENYSLGSERSMNINLGINVGPFYINKHQIKLNTNLFYRDTKDKIKLDVKNDQTAEVSNYVNENSFLSTGFDAELGYSYNKKLNIVIGASIFNSRFNTQYNENGEPYQWYKNRERNAPYFTLNTNIKYDLENFIQKKSKVSIYYNLGYVHEFFRDWESLGGSGKDIIPSQLVNSLGGTYSFPKKKVTISFDAKNIFNQQVFDNYALQKPGRAFYIKLSYKLL